MADWVETRSTAVLATGSIELVSAMRTTELNRRPSRGPDYEAENCAFVELAETLAAAPQDILQVLVEKALSLCGAHSAGVSLYGPEIDIPLLTTRARHTRRPPWPF